MHDMVKIEKMGKLVNHGSNLEPHELATVDFFLRLGEDIEIILSTYTSGNSNADFIMQGIIWETKSPTTNNIRSISRLFHRTTVQSPNIIFDLRRVQGDATSVEKQLIKLFQTSRIARKIQIITKTKKLLTFSKS